jgi:putative membrane protein
LQVLAAVLIGAVAALHVYFLVLEMFLWTTPFGRRTLRLTPEFTQTTRTIAANQGLYNGFLAAGLIWAVAAYGVHNGRPVLTFFLVCIVAAGVFGGVTLSRGILLVQALPGLVAAVFLWLA